MTKIPTAQSRARERATSDENPAPAVSTAAFANILCAVDGTHASTVAVRMAVCLAGTDGHLTLLAVTAESGFGSCATANISPAASSTC